MSAISDPARPSRRDRRRAQSLIDTAFAEDRLTAADRALRTQRIQAAHTRGDLAMITRDLVAPVQANLGRALDPSTMASMRVGSAPRRTGTAGVVGSGTPTIDLSGVGRKVRLFVLIAVAGVVLSCLLGLLAFVPAVISAFEPGATESQDAPGTSVPRQSPGQGVQASVANLHTAAGWSGLVRAIKAESGSTQIYDLVAYPQYASVGLDGKDAVERRFYRDGAWQDSTSVRTPIVGSLVDLSAIDAEMVARLPGETAQHFGLDDPSGTYIIVNAFAGGPRIMIYVQGDSETRYRIYRLDGTPIS